MRERHKPLLWFLIAGSMLGCPGPRGAQRLAEPAPEPSAESDHKAPGPAPGPADRTRAPATLGPGTAADHPSAKGAQAVTSGIRPTQQVVARGENPAIDALVLDAIAEGKLPGAVVAYGSGRGGLEFLRAYGDRAIEPVREAMTVDTIFDLASLSKAVMTSIIALQQVERGHLDLDAPAHQYLPELRSRARAIRVRDLLLHTAGLPRVTPRRAFEGPHAAAIGRLLAVQPEQAPGVRFRYGDTAFLWLGALLARVADAELGAYARTHIAEPLRLRSTFYGRVPESERGRTAPTEWAQARGNTMIRGETHDPRAYRLGGVAGNAGVFSSAGDLARLARALLLGGQLDGGRLLSQASVTELTIARRAGKAGNTLRALGWDVLSGYSRLRGGRLSAQAYGHGGFTGTSLWVDPGRDLFVVFLSNRVHPAGKGYVLPLIGAVTDAAVAGRAPGPVPLPVSTGLTLTGSDRLAHDIGPLRGRRIGLVVNRASRDRKGRRTLDALHAHPEVGVIRVFAPEHGVSAAREGHIADGREAETGLPVTSLFGKTRRPTAEMLAGLDTLVFDLQDVGARFFTYMSTLRELLSAAKTHGLRVVVLDRPNPIGAHVVEGPVTEPGVQTFVHYHPLPVRHGLTAGELAQLLNATPGLGADLEVVWMEHYCRELPFGQTGLTWTGPSPNLERLESTLLYPAVALLESTNVSVGRGTDRAFQVLGAPWLEPEAWRQALVDAGVPGLSFGTTRFTPHSGPHRGKELPGLALELTSEVAFRAVDTGRALAHTLRQTHGARFHLADMDRMLADRGTLRSLQTPDYRQPTATHILRLAAFLRERREHLHYRSCFE